MNQLYLKNVYIVKCLCTKDDRRGNYEYTVKFDCSRGSTRIQQAYKIGLADRSSSLAVGPCNKQA